MTERYKPGTREFKASSEGEKLWPELRLGQQADISNENLFQALISDGSGSIRTTTMFGHSSPHCPTETESTVALTGRCLSITQCGCHKSVVPKYLAESEPQTLQWDSEPCLEVLFWVWMLQDSCNEKGVSLLPMREEPSQSVS